LNRRLGGSESRFEIFGEENNFLSLLFFKPLTAKFLAINRARTQEFKATPNKLKSITKENTKN
jgi:hypothetical protein